MYADRTHEPPAPSAGWNDEPSRAAVFDDVVDAVYTTDADGWLTYYNKAAADLWGYWPELGKTRWCGSWRIYAPDGAPLPLDQCPMAVALKQGRDVRGVEVVLERPDGTLIPFAPYPTPLRDASGKVVAASNILVKLDRLTAPTVSDRVGDEPAAISPLAFEGAFDGDTLTDCLKWTLSALADIELAFQTDRARLDRWTGSVAEKARIRRLLESRRLTQREPLIQVLNDIHDHAQPVIVDDSRGTTMHAVGVHEAIEIVRRAAQT